MRSSLLLVCLVLIAAVAEAVELEGRITDAATGLPVAARVYLERVDDGSLHFVRSASETAAVPYEKSRPNTRSLEKHTSVPAGSFVAELPANPSQ